MRDTIIRWIGLLIFIAISILLVKFLIYILPILFGIFIGYLLYSYFREKMNGRRSEEFVKSRPSTRSNKKGKSKKIVIIDEER